MRGGASSKPRDDDSDDGENTCDADADGTTWRSGIEDDVEEEEEEDDDDDDDGPGERGYAGERGRHRSEVSRRTRGSGGS